VTGAPAPVRIRRMPARHQTAQSGLCGLTTDRGDVVSERACVAYLGRCGVVPDATEKTLKCFPQWPAVGLAVKARPLRTISSRWLCRRANGPFRRHRFGTALSAGGCRGVKLAYGRLAEQAPRSPYGAPRRSLPRPYGLTQLTNRQASPRAEAPIVTVPYRRLKRRRVTTSDTSRK